MSNILRSVRAALVLAVVAGTTLAASPAQAATSFVDGDFAYSINGDGVTATLTGYSGGSPDVEIPASTSDGDMSYDVTSIGDEAFDGDTLGLSLTSVVVPDSVVSIGDRAFYDNRELASLVIGDHVETIGDYAFSGLGYEDQEPANALTAVAIPDSVVTIGDGAFAGNLGVTDLTLGDGVTTIGAEAFLFASLTSVTIPDSVKAIGERAFFYNSITSVTLGARVESIGASAFGGNNDLASVRLAGDAPTITAAGEAGSFGTGGSDDVVPLTVFYTDGAGFTNPWNGYQTQQIAIFFVDGDFTYSVNSDGVTATVRGYSGTSSDVEILASAADGDVTYDVTEVGGEAFDGDVLGFSLTSVVIPDSVVSIGDRAFYGNRDLASLVIGRNVKTIGEYAFSAAGYEDQEPANALTAVVIPDSVVTIGDGAFAGNLGVTELTLGDGVTTIGAEAFLFASLTSVTIPDSVTAIGERAFFYNSITWVTIGTGIETVGAAAFGGNNNLVAARFMGAPPVITAAGESGSFGTGGSDDVVLLTVFYSPGADFTNPWHGYQTRQLGTVTSTLEVTPDGPLDADGAQTYAATVTVQDELSAPVAGLPVAFTVPADVVASAAECTTIEDGTCAVELTSAVPGTYDVFATIFGADVANSPQPVTFAARAASVTTSTIAVSATTIVANGTDSSTITVTGRDADGDLLASSGGVVTILSTIGTVSSVTDNGDGTYTATLTAGETATAGTATLSFTINGMTADGTASVTVEAAPGSPAPDPTTDPSAAPTPTPIATAPTSGPGSTQDLPRTGADPTASVLFAGGFVLAGAALCAVALVRRRRAQA